MPATAAPAANRWGSESIPCADDARAGCFNGVRPQLCAAPSGPFRQLSPDPIKTTVAQQTADRQQIHARFQQPGRKRMAQRVRRHVLRDPGFDHRRLAALLNCGRADADVERRSRKQVLRRSHLFPVLAKFCQQSRRHGHQPFLLTFAAELCESADVIGVGIDGPRCEIPQEHVFGHATDEWCLTLLPWCH